MKTSQSFYTFEHTSVNTRKTYKNAADIDNLREISTSKGRWLIQYGTIGQGRAIIGRGGILNIGPSIGVIARFGREYNASRYVSHA